jgi:hypothetical protein
MLTCEKIILEMEIGTAKHPARRSRNRKSIRKPGTQDSFFENSWFPGFLMKKNSARDEPKTFHG